MQPLAATGFSCLDVIGKWQKFTEEFCVFIFLLFYVHWYSYNAERTVKDCLTVTSSLWPLFLPPGKMAIHFLVKKETLLI